MNSIKLFWIFVIIFSSKIIVAQEITMFPGFFKESYYVDDKKSDKKEVGSLMLQNKEAAAYWKTAKITDNVASGLLVAQIVLLVYGINEKSEEILYTSIGTGIVGLAFSLGSSSNKRKAILAYNKGLKNKEKTSFAPAKNGVGLCLNF